MVYAGIDFPTKLKKRGDQCAFAFFEVTFVFRLGRHANSPPC